MGGIKHRPSATRIEAIIARLRSQLSAREEELRALKAIERNAQRRAPRPRRTPEELADHYARIAHRREIRLQQMRDAREARL